MSGLQPWDRPSTWIPAVLIGLVLNWYTFSWVYCSYGYEGKVGWGTSMAPNIHTGDDLFYVPWLYSVRDPARGDTVTFWARGWDGKQTFLLKRVIGLPGETVSLGNGQIRINGKVLDEEYVLLEWTSGSSYRSWTVPEGKYFMMGDNRGNSWDSRDFGYIERDKLTPVVLHSSAIYQWRDALFLVWCGLGGFLAWQSAYRRGLSSHWAWLGVVLQGVGVGIVMMIPEPDEFGADAEMPQAA